MLEVVFYESNQDLLGMLNSQSTPLVVCPSPKIADNLRSLAPKLEVVTISKWTSDHLKNLNLTRSRKSHLMVKLSAVWRHYFPSEKTTVFTEAFELFTELRSYTLNLELLSEFLKEIDERVVKSILIFWTYLEQEKLIDEHLAYKKVTESDQHRPMWMIGFKHMSGVQIDMLKSIAEEHGVKIYFPRAVFLESLPTDWIGWITGGKTHSLKMSSPEKTARVIIMPKGKSNIILDKLLEKNNDHDLVLATKQSNLLSFQELQRENSFFKTSEDLFGTEIELLFANLRKDFAANPNLTIEQLNLNLTTKKEDSILRGEYRMYKVIELLEMAIVEYSEFHKSIDSFAIDVFQIIVRLNAPRVSFFSLEQNVTRSILDLNDLDFRVQNKNAALIATSSMGGFRASEKILSEAMTKALRNIGPIKRAGLDFIFYKNELLSLLANQKTVLLIEEQLLETDLSWREILKDFHISILDLDVEYSIKKIVDHLTPRRKIGPFLQKYFSASKLQVFIDCPQKYYFNYIQKIENRPEERSSLSPDELGNLEHEIIEKYFSSTKSNSEIDLELHRKTCVQVFNHYLSQGRLVLSETEKAKAYNEIMHYSWNGIVFLLDLVQSKRAKNIKFEVQIESNPWHIKGSLDCLLELENNQVILIDFKRSSAATGTKAETLNFQKIQMWVYLLTLVHQGYKIDSFGYLNLSDLSERSLFFETDTAQKMIEVSLAPAREFIEKTIQDIQTLNIFSPSPREPKVCRYCPVSLFCIKGDGCD